MSSRSLIVMPDDTGKPLLDAINGASKSIRVKIFLFSDPSLLAAVIAAQHPKWDERPVIIAIKAPDSEITEQALLDYFADKVAKWQIPDKVIFVESIPLSGTGKMLKKDLREQFGKVLLST